MPVNLPRVKKRSVARSEVSEEEDLPASIKHGACLCSVRPGDRTRYSFPPVFHGKGLYNVTDGGVRVRYITRFASCVQLGIEVDFALAKKEHSRRRCVGHWGSEWNWKTDCASFSSQRFALLCFTVNIDSITA